MFMLQWSYLDNGDGFAFTVTFSMEALRREPVSGSTVE